MFDIVGKPVLWFTGFMKTTMLLPDDLMTEVKIEAVHQRRRLNDLVPELLRIGLANQRHSSASSFKATDIQRGQTWLKGWQQLGAGIENRVIASESCVSMLEADRGTRG